MIAEREIAKIIISFLIFLSKHLMESIKGASFCQIRIIIELTHCKPSITWGIQK